MSRIITFYSYKGGVGRTFALANVAALLAKRGKRVLLMDWDLEAPGLHRYFEPYLKTSDLNPKGLIHLLHDASGGAKMPWDTYTSAITIKDCKDIHLIGSGDHSPDYVKSVREFSWTDFFEKHAGGDLLNQWRSEWRTDYDYILIDSRTGITDTGGVCTIYLPDILVLVFAANEQSFSRGVQIVEGVQHARRDLAVPRPPLTILPLAGRFDGRDEVDDAQKWLDRFGKDLKPFYDDWLPTEFNPRQILELTKIPYVTKFSFGEPLPVITQGTSDPEFPGFYLENVARLLVSDFKEARQIISPETSEGPDAYEQLRSLIVSIPIDESAIERALKEIEPEVSSLKYTEFLFEAASSLVRNQKLPSAEAYFRRVLECCRELRLQDAPVALSATNGLAELLVATRRFSEAETLYRGLLVLGDKIDATMQLVARLSLANICQQTARNSESEDWYRGAKHVAEKMGADGRPALLTIYNNLGELCRRSNRFGESLDWYERALHLVRNAHESDNSAEIQICNNLASVCLAAGRNDDAIQWSKQALTAIEHYRHSARSVKLAAYNNLAEALNGLGQYEESIDWLRRALNEAESSEPINSNAILAINSNLAALHQRLGKTLEAVNYYKSALDLVHALEAVTKLRLAS